MPKKVTIGKSTGLPVATPAKRPTKKRASWKGYLDDLDALYHMALEKENIAAALKIKEIQIKTHQQDQENVQNFDLDQLSDEHLDRLIDLIEGKSLMDSVGPESFA